MSVALDRDQIWVSQACWAICPLICKTCCTVSSCLDRTCRSPFAPSVFQHLMWQEEWERPTHTQLTDFVNVALKVLEDDRLNEDSLALVEPPSQICDLKLLPRSIADIIFISSRGCSAVSVFCIVPCLKNISKGYFFGNSSTRRASSWSVELCKHTNRWKPVLVRWAKYLLLVFIICYCDMVCSVVSYSKTFIQVKSLQGKMQVDSCRAVATLWNGDRSEEWVSRVGRRWLQGGAVCFA